MLTLKYRNNAIKDNTYVITSHNVSLQNKKYKMNVMGNFKLG